MPPHTAHASSCIAPRIGHAPLWTTSRLGWVSQRFGITCRGVAQRFQRCDESSAPDVGFSPRGQAPRQLKEHSKTPAAPWKSGASAPRLSRRGKHSTRNPRHLSVPHRLTFACLWVPQGWGIKCFWVAQPSGIPGLWVAQRFQRCDRSPAPDAGFSPRISFCERTMNSTCGKTTLHPRTKPVIAGDTTYGVSLLTGTISGSNFAIPWPLS